MRKPTPASVTRRDVLISGADAAASAASTMSSIFALGTADDSA
jgi:hypothetical protein